MSPLPASPTPYSPAVSSRLVCVLVGLATLFTFACSLTNLAAFAYYMQTHGYPRNGAVAIWAVGILFSAVAGFILLGLTREHVRSRRPAARR